MTIRTQTLWPAAVLVALFMLLTLPMAGSERAGASESFDERAHHLPLIVTFAVQWPAFDVASYNAAMTPGYHIAMAAVYRLSGRSVTAVRIANGVLALALALVVLRLAQTFVTPWTGLALTLPLVCSPYFLGSAIWLTTDNSALLLVTIVLGDVLRHRATSARTLWRGVVSAAAVLVRQVSVWIVAPVALSALSEWRSRGWAAFTPVVIATIVASVAPLGVAIAFFLIWNGLTPPVFQSQHASGPDPATPIAALALAGVYGFFFAGPRAVREELRHPTSVTLAAVVVVAGIIIPSSFDRDAGRWGGWVWELVRVAPVVSDRSIVLAALAPLGVFVIGALGRRAAAAGYTREAMMVLGALVMWLAVQTFNSQAWQRYLEPFLLVALTALTAFGLGQHARPSTVARARVRIVVLAALLLTIDAATMYGPAWWRLVNP